MHFAVVHFKCQKAPNASPSVQTALLDLYLFDM